MRWNPWRALREREHIAFSLSTLPASTGGAVYWPAPPWAAIIIDPTLARRERRSALAHELIHDERGGGASMAGMPVEWAPVVARDEAAVNREVAARLVPLDELQAMVEARASADIPVDALDVADEFDVPQAVASSALTQLANREAPCGG